MRNPAEILKIGIAVVENGRLLLVRKRGTTNYILPGGKPELGENDIDTLYREIAEELGCSLCDGKLTFIGEFSDYSADGSGRRVVVRLYLADLDGVPMPQSEIEEIRWYDVKSVGPYSLAPSLANSIIPHLVSNGHLDSRLRYN